MARDTTFTAVLRLFLTSVLIAPAVTAKIPWWNIKIAHEQGWVALWHTNSLCNSLRYLAQTGKRGWKRWTRSLAGICRPTRTVLSKQWNRDSSVNVATRLWNIWPGKCGSIASNPAVGLLINLEGVPGALPLEVKRPEHQTNHCRPSNLTSN